MEIIEGNKLIAEFMGTFKSCDGYGKNIEVISKSPGNTKVGGKLKYHLSWDWLIPVIEKIESLVQNNCMDCRITIEGKTCKVYYDKGIETYEFSKEANSKIESTWQVVAEFIKWYKNPN